MDIKLNKDQMFNAIFILVLQNNIALKGLIKTIIEYVAEKDGDVQADKFTLMLNVLSDETQHEILLSLKTLFGDVDDIDISDLLKKL